MNLIALDLGTTTGWAMKENRFGGGFIIHSGSQSFKPGRFDGGGMRYLRFSKWLDELASSPLDSYRVAFEEVRRHVGVDAAHAYGGFLATLTAWCESREIPYEGVPVGTIKKSWAGSGNASKEVMMKIAQERGFKPQDDNEADALALLNWMVGQYEATSITNLGSASDRQPKRRVPLGDLEVAGRAKRRRVL